MIKNVDKRMTSDLWSSEWFKKKFSGKDDIDVDLMKAMLQPPTLGNASSEVSFLYLWVYSTGLSTTKNFCLFNPKIGLI